MLIMLRSTLDMYREYPNDANLPISQLLRVTCGGWRRPFSYIVGEMPDFQHAFVFVKVRLIIF